MKEVRALVLGTDDNSYSVARSYYEAYGKKAITVGAGLLDVYRDTKISTLTYEKGFSSDDDKFVSLLNKEAAKYPDSKFIIFAPNESYLDILERNLGRLDFDYETAYPFGDIYKNYYHKSQFYGLLEELGIPYPKTQAIDKDSVEDLSLDGDLFMKPDDFQALYRLDLDEKQKGYRLSSNAEAKRIMKKIYEAGYEDEMIVQEFIHGTDGTEYSINGYRSTKGETSMVLARNLISDMRPLLVGNHLVQVDHEDAQMYALAKKIVDSLDYVGLFNFDFKKDSKTGKIYVLEMNQRQGRTFYYSTLGGVNLIRLAIEDKGYGKSETLRPTKKFRLIKLSEKYLEKHIVPELLDEFKEPARVENTANPNIMEEDMTIKRKLILFKRIKELERDIFKNS